jgi:hypothetical protein
MDLITVSSCTIDGWGAYWDTLSSNYEATSSYPFWCVKKNTRYSCWITRFIQIAK